MTDRPAVLRAVLDDEANGCPSGAGVLTMELPLTPLDFLLRARRLFPDREGVIEHRAGDVRTSSRMPRWPSAPPGSRRCCRTTSRVDPGDRVAWLCGNTHELLEAYYGVLLAGAVLLPLNIRLSAAELRGQLDDSRRDACWSAIPISSPRSTIRCGTVRARRRVRGAASPHNRSRGSIRHRSTSTPSRSSSTRAAPPGRPRERC